MDMDICFHCFTCYLLVYRKNSGKFPAFYFSEKLQPYLHRLLLCAEDLFLCE